MSFNLVDGLLLGLFALAVVDGARRGFAPWASELTAFVAGLALAFIFFEPPARLLEETLRVPPGLAGFGCFLILLVIGHGLAQGRLQRWLGNVSDRLSPRAGAVPALGTAVVLSAVVLSALVVMPTGSRSLVLSSTIGSTIARGSAFIQPSLHALLLPAARDSQNILDPRSQGQAPLGEDAFYRLQLPPDLQIELDVAAENRMLTQLNAARTHAGLTPLKVDPLLQAAARDHSREMYLQAYFSHRSPDGRTPFDRIRAAGVHYVTAGENIAFAGDAQQAEDSLMDSPDHRANILNPDFGRVGIGAYRGLGGYEEMFTQDFAD